VLTKVISFYSWNFSSRKILSYIYDDIKLDLPSMFQQNLS